MPSAQRTYFTRPAALRLASPRTGADNGGRGASSQFVPVIEEAAVRQTNLTGEPAEYISAREELRQAEIELMQHSERVAGLRRRLPQGPVVDDYAFEEGSADLHADDAPVRTVRLSELFTGPGRDLIVYHLMYGKQQTQPCPMCTMWLDGFNGIAHHVAQNIDLAVVAAAGLPALRAHARDRQWTNLRLLSAGSSTFKYDFGSEDAEGNQDSTVSVFTRDSDGSVRHFYSVHPRMSEDIDQRGIDLLSPVWQILDLTRRGREDWFPALSYNPARP
jgi:predicted dithiol-disulfide oxidoreductase (DUF899 family)